MKIHEYQGKQIFAKYGVPIPKGYPAFTVDEAEAAAKRLIDETEAARSSSSRRRSTPAVAARAAASRSPRAAPPKRAQLAEKILGMQLVTHQTGPAGAEGPAPLHRAGPRRSRASSTSAWSSTATSAASPSWRRPRAAWRSRRSPRETPEKILTVHVDPAVGLAGYQARELAFGLGLMKGGKETVGEVRPAHVDALRAASSRRTARSSRSTRSSSSRTATSSRSTRRSTSTTTPSSVTRSGPSSRTRTRKTRSSSRRSSAGPQLRLARRQHRLPRQRRGPRDGDDGHHQARRREARRRARELPRRRRRRHAGAGHQGLQHDPAAARR